MTQHVEGGTWPNWPGPIESGSSLRLTDDEPMRNLFRAAGKLRRGYLEAREVVSTVAMQQAMAVWGHLFGDDGGPASQCAPYGTSTPPRAPSRRQ